MNITFTLAWLSIILIGTSVSGQSLCEECLRTAQEELKKCLDGAISQEDKISCAEKKEARAKTCEDGECKIERTQGGSQPEGPSEKK